MLTRKQKADVARRAGKLSYQGKSLDSRIRNQMRLVESFRKEERQAKGAWLSSQLNVMIAEDELECLCAISLKQKEKK